MLIKGVLTEEQAAAGLTFEEDGDHIILLKDQGIPVAAFSQVSATPEMLRRHADRRMATLKLMRGGSHVGEVAGHIVTGGPDAGATGGGRPARGDGTGAGDRPAGRASFGAERAREADAAPAGGLEARGEG